ncbi:PREDICTED: uncharacterized protein LOC104740767 isoform X1 [Camelina sativa]|uniref:Uncharacterized protein LOC104740767 isoform X1 n=2 Tax=Camelina sativa TaxID=90675 RepID=A0ABM0VQR5_CAMSA|nr:PREDICTED: uncharacterized protein LOC104740767 isoform X1 [Camelina sativa]
MENKWSVVMMVFVLVVMAAIGGESADLSCETKCTITCRDSIFHQICLDGCLKSCRSHPPPMQLHTRMVAARASTREEEEEKVSLKCSFKCEFQCKLNFFTGCYDRCIREKCEHLPPKNTFRVSSSRSPMKTAGWLKK